MTIEEQLAQKVRQQILMRFEMSEIVSPSGGPLIPLRRWSWQCGAARLYKDSVGLDLSMVTIDLRIPILDLNSSMLYVFTASESATPHFTLDAVKRGKLYAVHCDLVPRFGKESIIYQEYIAVVFAPLKSAIDKFSALSGVKAYELGSEHRALFSPHSLCFQAESVSCLEQAEETVQSYLERLFFLVESDSPCFFDSAYLSAFDGALRAQMFSPKTDPIWIPFDILFGRKTGLAVRNLLQTGEIPIN